MGKIIGIEFVADFRECKNEKFLYSTNLKEFKKILFRLIKIYKMTKIGYFFYKFDTGFTGVIGLKESHIAFHTWPEEKYLSLNISICNYSRDNKKNAEGIFKELINLFLPKRIKKIKFFRKS